MMYTVYDMCQRTNINLLNNSLNLLIMWAYVDPANALIQVLPFIHYFFYESVS